MITRNSDYCPQREEFASSFIVDYFHWNSGFSIVLPFLVFLVIDLGGNAIVYGILSATYPAFQLIGAPLLGRWSDIYGRKKNSSLKSWRNISWMDNLPYCTIFTH